MGLMGLIGFMGGVLCSGGVGLRLSFTGATAARS